MGIEIQKLDSTEILRLDASSGYWSGAVFFTGAASRVAHGGRALPLQAGTFAPYDFFIGAPCVDANEWVELPNRIRRVAIRRLRHDGLEALYRQRQIDPEHVEKDSDWRASQAGPHKV